MIAVQIVHILLCILLIVLVLLQPGKADIGMTFGGGSQTVFGSRGPTTFLAKATVIVVLLFLGTTLYLAKYVGQAPQNTVLTPQNLEKLSAPMPETVPSETKAADSKGSEAKDKQSESKSSK